MQVAKIKGTAVVTQSVARLAWQAAHRVVPCILLLLDHDGNAAAPIRMALRQSSDSPRVLCAFTPAQAVRHLDRHTVDAVLMQLRFWDRLEPEAKRDLLTQAGARPIVVLLDEEDIVDPARAIEVGAVGYYYKDQLDARFIRRLDQLIAALAMRSSAPAAPASGR